MPKYPHKNIDAPGPAKGQRLDTTGLEATLRERCQFNGEETAVVYDVATEWAGKVDIPVKQAVTVASRIYWGLVDE